MTLAAQNELERFVLALCDDAITAEEFEALQATLTNSKEARQKYHELIELHNLLELQEEQAWQFGRANIFPIEELMAKQQRRLAVRALSAAAALILGAGILLRFIMIQGPTPTATVRISPYSELNVTHLKTDEPPPKSNTLAPGSSLELTQGTVELNFGSGVRSILRAPASITLTDEEHLVLREGTAWFHVPKKATGFEVITSRLRVVDLGTDFGIISTADPSGAGDEVHVFRGKVEATTRHGFRRTEIITAGSARRTHFTGRLLETPPLPTLYLSELPPGLPHLHWGFDHLEGNNFPVTGNLSLEAKVQSEATSPLVRQVPGKFGSALSFAPNQGHLKTSWPGINSNRPRTITCWIKCPPQVPLGSIVKWGVPLISSSKWRICLHPKLRGEEGVRGALRTEFGNGYVIGTTDLRDDRWHHVVSVYDGSSFGSEHTIRLYVDGRPEKISSSLENDISTILDDPRSEPCHIGAQFNGLIDELWIYEGVLPREAIGELLNSKPPE